MAKSLALWALTILVLQALYFSANVQADEGKAIHTQVKYGENITVVDDADELCNWDCKARPNLTVTWNSDDNWLLVTELYTEKQYQYKAVVVDTNGNCNWQPGKNREVFISPSFTGRDYFLNIPWDSSAGNEDIFPVV